MREVDVEPAQADEVSGHAMLGRLDLASKLTQPSVLPAVMRSRASSDHAPLVVELDPTSFCDSACPECVSQKLLRTTRFSGSRLIDLASEIVDAGVRAVVLIGGGEPLAHPATSKLIEALAAGSVHIGLTTSGTLLARHMDVVAEHVAWTRVSVDAATAETYELVRPHLSRRNYFETVISNMRQLAKLRRGQLGFSFVLTVKPTDTGGTLTNIQDLAAAAKLARDIGCDYFEVKPLYNLSHYLVSLSFESQAAINDQLAVVREMNSPTFEVISPSTLDQIMSGKRIQIKSYTECDVANLRTLITSSGAYLCPYHRGNPLAKYGDPQVESFREMWGKQQRVARQIDPTRDCRFHCIRHESNLMIDQLISGGRPRTSEDRGTDDLFI